MEAPKVRCMPCEELLFGDPWGTGESLHAPLPSCRPASLLMKHGNVDGGNSNAAAKKTVHGIPHHVVLGE